MKYYCKGCDKAFKKFIFYEGHVDYNDKCRAKHKSFLQCYVCKEEYRHLATLKYHLQQHSTNYVYKKQHLKMTIKINHENNKWKGDESIPNKMQCKIFEESFRTNFKRHLITHSKNRLTENVSINKNTTSKQICLQGSVQGKIVKSTSPSSARGLIQPTTVSTMHLKTSAASSGSVSKTKSSRRYQCKLCKVICSSATRFGKNNFNLSLLTIKFCCKNVIRFLAVHLKLHTEGKYECKICKIKFSRLSLAYHLKIVHHKKFGRQCKICKACFSTHSTLGKMN